jgi:DNA-binding transcriptional LysR family regulator
MSIASRIKPNHLELVVKIAETRQLQLAAQAVATSQPAASRILSELEAQLGDKLFTRHPTGMEPTPAGEVLIRHARVVLSELETIVDEVGRVGSGDLGHARVGAVTGPVLGHLMPAVQALLTEAPDLRISVDVAPSSVLYRGLEEARYDFILGRTNPRSNPQDLRYHPGRAELVSLMVHKSHPLAGKPDLDMAELAGFPWVIQEEGSPIRDAVEQAFHAESIPVPTRVLNSSSLLVALAQIAGGQAISPQTEEVIRLLVSSEINADVTVLNTSARITVAPYFVIQNAHRKLPRAAERLLNAVMAQF